jgi:hypothetical protein
MSRRIGNLDEAIPEVEDFASGQGAAGDSADGKDVFEGPGSRPARIELIYRELGIPASVIEAAMGVRHLQGEVGQGLSVGLQIPDPGPRFDQHGFPRPFDVVSRMIRSGRKRILWTTLWFGFAIFSRRSSVPVRASSRTGGAMVVRLWYRNEDSGMLSSPTTAKSPGMLSLSS